MDELNPSLAFHPTGGCLIRKNDFVLQNVVQFISYALHRTDGRAAFALARRIAPSREGLTAAFALEHVPNHIQKKKQQTQKREN